MVARMVAQWLCADGCTCGDGCADDYGPPDGSAPPAGTVARMASAPHVRRGSERWLRGEKGPSDGSSDGSARGEGPSDGSARQTAAGDHVVTTGHDYRRGSVMHEMSDSLEKSCVKKYPRMEGRG